MLEGRSALVTGGGSGIGYAIAEAFLANGADVVISGRSESKLRAAAEKLGSSGRGACGWIVLDNSDVAGFEPALDAACSQVPSGFVDLLVNNAGVNKGGPMSSISVADYDAVLDVNLRGAYFMTQVVAGRMVKQSIRGNVLNIASSSSLRPAASPYTLSKWGIRGLTLGAAKALIPHGIVVNGLAPGPTATPMLLEDCSDLDNDRVPSGRYAAPEEIANMAVVLTSDLGRMVVGDIVYMTGGCGNLSLDDMKYEF